MLRLGFHESLTRLEDHTLRLGHNAQSLVLPAARALLEADHGAGLAIVGRDDQIDLHAQRTQEQVRRLILLQAPVADDLRRLLSMIHATRSIERIGDHCVNMARLAGELDPTGRQEELHDQFHELALRANRTVVRGLDFFGLRAPDGLGRLEPLEEGVDLLRSGLVLRLTEHAEQGGAAARWSIPLIQAARHLERISDHAVSLAEQAAWVATGEWPG